MSRTAWLRNRRMQMFSYVLNRSERKELSADGGDGGLGQSADGEQSQFDQHGEAPTPNTLMRFQTSEWALNSAVM